MFLNKDYEVWYKPNLKEDKVIPAKIIEFIENGKILIDISSNSIELSKGDILEVKSENIFSR